MPEKSPQERTLLTFLDAIDGEAETARGKVDKSWDENIKLGRGEGQWKSTRPPLFLYNLIGNEIERKIARLTEAKPTYSIISRLTHLMKMSKVLNATCKAILESEEFPLTMERSARFGSYCGASLVSTVFDNSLPDGGDIRVTAWDNRAVYIDPSVTEAARLSQQARYIRMDSVMSLDEIRKMFPGRGALVSPDTRYSRYRDMRGGRSTVSSVLNVLPRVLRPSEPARQGPIDRAILKEYWYRDPDEDTWPGGRHIFRAGDIILKDEANPYWDGEFPIDMVDWRMDVDSPWGMDDVRDLKKLNESMNRLGDGIMRNAMFASQAWVIADQDAVDPEMWKKITSEGGLIVRKRPTREFRRDPAPQLPGFLFQMLTTIPQFAAHLTGNDEAGGGGKGNKKGGAEGVIDGLQSAGSSMARVIARRYESFVSRIGQKIISRVLQFYDEDRMLSFYDLNGEMVNYLFEKDGLRYNDDGSLVDASKLRTLYKSFRFVVQPYSSMASTKMQRAQVAIGLWQASGGKGYPFKRVLEHADVGDPDALMAEAKSELQEGVISPPSPPTKR
jgi:hypothetical protein